jgi:hypothetical protein
MTATSHTIEVRSHLAHSLLWMVVLRVFSVSTSIALALGMPAICFAAAGLAQGYRATESLPSGSLVSVDSQNTNSVVSANADRLEGLVGVVVNSNDALLLVSSGLDQVQVATTGVVTSLVSDLGGDIAVGDKIAPSAINGVGMKATTSTKVVGIAQAVFNSKSEGVVKRTIKDRAGNSKEVSVGRIPVIVGVAYYVVGTGSDKTVIPAFIQNLANEIAGRKVSPLPIIVSVVIIIISLIVVTSLVYGAIKSSIISIGRNPLSQGAVYRSLLQVSALAMGILLVATTTVYLILSRG